MYHAGKKEKLMFKDKGNVVVPCRERSGVA